MSDLGRYILAQERNLSGIEQAIRSTEVYTSGVHRKRD